jgi:hypothetical protein
VERTDSSITHARKDVKHLPRRRDLEDKISEAVIHTGMIFGGTKYRKTIEAPLTICGKTVTALMGPKDEPILFIPTFVGDTGEPGCVLTFEDGAIVAWSEGRLRLTYFATRIHKADVQELTRDQYAIDLLTDRPWRIQAMASAFNDPKFFDAMVQSLGGDR